MREGYGIGRNLTFCNVLRDDENLIIDIDIVIEMMTVISNFCRYVLISSDARREVSFPY
jgi:predicted nucleotidyltransferase